VLDELVTRRRLPAVFADGHRVLTRKGSRTWYRRSARSRRRAELPRARVTWLAQTQRRRAGSGAECGEFTWWYFTITRRRIRARDGVLRRGDAAAAQAALGGRWPCSELRTTIPG